MMDPWGSICQIQDEKIAKLEADNDRLRALIVEYAESWAQDLNRNEAAHDALLAAAAGKQDEEPGEKRRVGDLIWGAPDIVLCPQCDQSERRGHSPDCPTPEWRWRS